MTCFLRAASVPPVVFQRGGTEDAEIAEVEKAAKRKKRTSSAFLRVLRASALKARRASRASLFRPFPDSSELSLGRPRLSDGASMPRDAGLQHLAAFALPPVLGR